MRDSIKILEVCPRDGWQNLHDYIPVETKIKHISNMLDSGIQYMQLTSFVSPKAIPQLKDAAEICAIILDRYPNRNFCALVPNLKGAQNAEACGMKEISFVISVSESHNKANINRTHEESFRELSNIQEKLPNLEVVPALGTVFGCPFEGRQPIEKVMRLVERLIEMGFSAIELADTIGTGNPADVAKVFSTVKHNHPNVTLLAHIHDTRNNGILNSWVAAQNGADILHSSLGGLGGCPFAPGASGNVATEDLVWLMEESGIKTGIDVTKLIEAAKMMHAEIPGNYSGHHVTIEHDVYEEACKKAS
jgi:hydroxymethylglutaryl-CoA lyase